MSFETGPAIGPESAARLDRDIGVQRMEVTVM